MTNKTLWEWQKRCDDLEESVKNLQIELAEAFRLIYEIKAKLR